MENNEAQSNEPQDTPTDEVVHYPEPLNNSSPQDEQESSPEEPTEVPQSEDEKQPGKFARAKAWYFARKKITIPGSILLLLLILAAIPASRYGLAGQVVAKNVSVEVKDSLTGTPVSGAEVSFGNQNVLTDAAGKTTLYKLRPGPKSITISKKYYKDDIIKSTVSIFGSQADAKVSLVATGRQVKVEVTDYIDGKTLDGVSINVADTTAKTDKNGQATIVVPVGSSTLKATLSLDGYNNKDIDIKVDNQKVAVNNATLTPSGKVYFFSKRTGKLDLLKANLDGSDVSTVVPASGYEQNYASSISQSPDWKYVGLITRRSADDATPQLYVLSTSDDKLISIDGGKSNYSFQGWSGDNLIYTVSRTDLPDWQPGKNKLKSYNAATGKITQLDQTNGVSGTDGTAYESYVFEMVSGNTVIFAKNWQFNGSQSQQSNSLHSINADGQNHKVIATYEANNKPAVYYSQHSANSLYIWQQDSTGSGTYYDFSIGSSAPKKVDIDSNTFYQGSQGYYPSPSGKQILWTEMRDGKNAILIGDQNGGNPKTIGSFSEYLPFGWFTDKYLILSKNSNELYVMSAKQGAEPLKITDYQYTNYYY